MLMHSLKLGYFITEWLHNEHEVKHTDFFTSMINNAQLKSLSDFFDGKLESILEGKGRGTIVPDCGDVYWDVEEAAFINCMEHKQDFYQHFVDAACGFLWEKRISHVSGKLLRMVDYQMSRIPTKEDFGGDKERFARESIMWARKSGTMLLPERVMA